MRKTCYKCFGLGHTADVCKKEKRSWEQYRGFLKEKLEMGPEFTGKTEDNMNKESSKEVGKPTQTDDETQSDDETQAKEETQAIHVDETNNRYEKESTMNTTVTPETKLERVQNQIAAKELEGTEKKKTSSKIPRVSTRKRIPHEKLRN